MARNLGKEVRSTRKGLLQSEQFLQPGKAISDSIIAGRKFSRSRGDLFTRVPGAAGEAAEKSRWSKAKIASEDEASLMPCMTAIIIEWLQRGQSLRRGRRTPAMKGAE